MANQTWSTPDVVYKFHISGTSFMFIIYLLHQAFFGKILTIMPNVFYFSTALLTGLKLA